MLDQTATAILPPRQRVSARAAVSFGRRDGRTVLGRLAQQGSAKAMLPRVHRAVPELVFLNTAGGLTGGDVIGFDLQLAAGTRVVATTQTAERAYGSLADLPPARLDVTADLAAGAHLDWLPQETILFDRAALHRRTEIRLVGDATCLLAECVVLGRAAMGETVRQLDFRDSRMVRRDGHPVLYEPLRIATAQLATRNRPAGLGDARAFATIALVAVWAPDRAAALRPLMQAEGIRAAVSGWDGRLVIRALGAHPHHLRRWMAAVLTELRGPLPRVWTI